MTGHRVTRFAGTAIVAGSLGLATVATAGTASALTGDNTEFFDQIEAAGIGYDSPAAAVKNAEMVCSLLAKGNSAGSIGNEITHNSNLSNRQAAVFIVASVDSFCPKYADSL
jgi:hypothetical protein